MGTRFKELSVLLLDVSPSMAPHIPYLRRAVLTFLHSKLVYKKSHEIAIVLYGTRGTSNLVHDEAIAENPANFAEYTNIITLEKMHKPTFATMKAVDEVFTKLAESSGSGFLADVDDALIVAWDLINRSFIENQDRIKYPTKRIILISNFLSRKRLNDEVSLLFDTDDVDGSGRGGGLASTLLANNIALDVISLDIPGDEVDASIQAVKKDNNDLLDRLSTQINMNMRSITYVADLAGVFPVAGEHTVTATYATVDLCLGDKLKIAVKFALKTKQERTPSLGKESPLIRGEAGRGDGASGSLKEEEAEGRSSPAPGEGGELPGIKKSIEYYREEDKDQLEPVPPEDMVKAFRYGREVVPMDANEIDFATYEAENGLQVLGFITGTAIPRHYSMADPYMLIANKDHPQSQTAFTALTTAVFQENKVAIMRFVSRNKVKILTCRPVLATGTAPAHFICTIMPWQEDIRDFHFATFEKEERKPSESQLIAALNLIDAMPLHRTAPLAARGLGDLKDLKDNLPSIKEDLVPERTANPIANRFVYHFIEKALHPGDATITPPAPENDPLLQRILPQHRPDIMPTAEIAAEAVKNQFPIGQVARAARQKLVRKLSPGKENEDFISMMEQTDYHDAISNMRKHIESIVETSIAGQRYPDAITALRLLREQCIKYERAESFNKQLDFLKGKYAKDTTRGKFWELVCKERVGLVSAEEAAAVKYTNLVQGGSGGEGGNEQHQQLPSKEEAATWMGCAAGAASDEESL
ncbi:hypothetical protein Ndes2526B_g04120 [Nannochloris sp. 'desiccata']|nr:hypothetical protein KSW81_001099 [Chlorella desiccata (nom. nud.)]KAH7620206.1 putative ATP-dependent DNA helicase 2 subunit KU80 [Chlorella desiccata (nom. nud.)]